MSSGPEGEPRRTVLMVSNPSPTSALMRALDAALVGTGVTVQGAMDEAVERVTEFSATIEWEGEPVAPSVAIVGGHRIERRPGRFEYAEHTNGRDRPGYALRRGEVVQCVRCGLSRGFIERFKPACEPSHVGVDLATGEDFTAFVARDPDGALAAVSGPDELQPETAAEARARGIVAHCDDCWADHCPSMCPVGSDELEAEEVCPACGAQLDGPGASCDDCGEHVDPDADGVPPVDPGRFYAARAGELHAELDRWVRAVFQAFPHDRCFDPANPAAALAAIVAEAEERGRAGALELVASIREAVAEVAQRRTSTAKVYALALPSIVSDPSAVPEFVRAVLAELEAALREGDRGRIIGGMKL